MAARLSVKDSVQEWITKLNNVLDLQTVDGAFVNNATKWANTTFTLSGGIARSSNTFVDVPGKSITLPFGKVNVVGIDPIVGELTYHEDGSLPSDKFIPLYVVTTNNERIVSAKDLRTWAYEDSSAAADAVSEHEAKADPHGQYALMDELSIDYAAGIELESYTQIIRDSSSDFWRVSGSTALPYTTTGAGLPEGGAFVTVGDAALRQELAAGVATGQGALNVSGSVIYVDTIADLQALPAGELVDGQTVNVSGSLFKWNGVSFDLISPLSVFSFGAVGDGTTDDRPAIQAALDYMEAGQELVFPSGHEFKVVNATSSSGATIVERRANAVAGGTLYALTSGLAEITVTVDGTITGTSALDDIMRLSGSYVVVEGSGKIQNTSGEYLDTNSTDTLVQWRPSLIVLSGDDCSVIGLSFVDQPTVGIYDKGNSNTIRSCHFYGGPSTRGSGTVQFGVQQTVSGDVRRDGSVIGCRFYRSPENGACYSGVFSICKDAKITNNSFIDLLEHGVYANSTDAIISENHFKDIKNAAAIQAFNGGTIVGNRFQDCLFGQINVQRPNKTIISKNVVTGGGLTGVSVRKGSSDAAGVTYNSLSITENIIEYSGNQSPIDISIADTYLQNITVHGNILNCSGTSDDYGAIRIDSGLGYSNAYLSLIGNTITGSDIYGIYLRRVVSSKISDNLLINVNQTLSTAACRFFGCSDIEFSRNTVIDYKTTKTTATLLFASKADGNSKIHAFDNNGIGITGASGVLCQVTPDGSAHGNGRNTRGTRGSFTAANVASGTITGSAAGSVRSPGLVVLHPANQTADIIQNGAQRIRVTAVGDGSFTWSTTSGAAIGTGSAVYFYEVVQ